MANGNPWFSAVEQTLPQYVPLPFQELAAAGQAIQSRYDTAMAGLDATATGLATIEARLPGHQQYVSEYANRFRTEADELLSRYNYNAADPQFGRELTRLRSRYQNDPNLRTIQSANQMYDANLKTRQKLMETGQRFIDTTRGRTGIDPETGRLTADTGMIRATNYDEDLRTMFRDTLQATINDGRGRITNEAAVANTIENLMSGGANNPVLREGMEYYMSQGMSPEQAQQQLQLDIQREATSALTSDRDSGYFSNQLGWANYNLSRDKFAYEQFKDQVKTQLDRQAVTNSVGFLDSKELNKGIIDNVNTLKKSIGKEGNLQEVKYHKNQSILDSPENRALLDSRGVKYQKQSLGSSDIAGGESRLIIQEDFEGIPSDTRQSIDKIKNELIDMGVGFSSDREALDRYNEILERDSAAPLYYNVGSAKIRKALDDNFIGDNNQHIQQGVIVDNKGKSYKVTDNKFDLSKIDGRFRVEGFSPFPHVGDKREFTGGAIKANAVTKDGETVSVYLPMTPELQGIMRNTNTAARATASGLSNTELRQSIEYRMPVTLSNGETGIIVPQRNQYGNWDYWQIEPSTGRRLREINAEDIFAGEKADVGQYLGLQGD